MAANDLAQLRRWTHQQDADAFDDLVRQYAGMVFGAARRILKNDAEAEEVAQECFLKLAQADAGVSTNVPGWLHRTATNLSLNRYKENKRRAARDTAYADEHGASSPAVIWNDVEPLVDAAIDELPEDIRRVVVRHFLEGASYRVLAEEFGISRAQVIYRTQRGVQQIRSVLKRKGVKISGGALAGLLTAHCTVEASASLIGALGKVALAGPGAVAPIPVAAAAAPVGSFALVQPVLFAALALVVAAGGWFAVRGGWFSTASPPAEPIAQAQEPAPAPSPILPTSTISNVAQTGALANIPLIVNSKASTETGPGEIRGTAFLEPIGRSTSNPPLPPDGYVEIRRITWTPYDLAPHDIFMQIATVGEDNFFRFENIPLGVYAVRVVAGDRTAANYVALTADEPRKHVAVGQSYRIARTIGIVKDEDGNPLPGANVMIVKFADTQSEATNEWQVLAASQTTTGPDGGFAFEYTGTGDKAPRQYAVLVRKEGYAAYRSEWFEGGRDNLVFQMARGATASGTVIDDATGKPATTVRLRIATDFKWDRREVITDAQGKFSIDHLGPYWFTIQTVNSPSIVSGETTYVNMAKSLLARDLKLDLVPGGRVFGRVSDLATDRGYANVAVYLHDPGTVLRNDYYTGYNIRQADRTTMTDAEGRYSFEGVPNGKYWIERANIAGVSTLEGEASKDRLQLTLVNAAGDPSNIDFDVKRGNVISGQVVGPDGRPVVDAVVFAYDREQGPPPGVMYSPVGMNWSATDAQGRFAVSGLEDGKDYFVTAERDKPFLVPDGLVAHPVGPFEVHGDVSDVRITMQPESRIVATVVDTSGHPILNARVHAYRIQGNSSRDIHFRATAFDGRVSVDKLTEGTYELRVDVPSMGGQSVGPLANVKVGVGEKVGAGRLVYDAPRGIEVTGRVIDSAGRSVFGVRVTATNGGNYTGQSGNDGAFKLAGLEKGSYLIEASHADYSPYRLPNYKAGPAPLLIQLRGRGSVTGEVYHNGVPVKEFTVLCFPDDRTEAFTGKPLIDLRLSQQGIRGNDGRFTYDRIVEGDATVVVFADGLVPAFQVIRGIREGQVYRCPPFNLANGAILEGIILDSDGKPAAGCGIAIGENWRMSQAPANSEGRFWLKGLPAGDLQVWFLYRDMPRQSQTVSIRPGVTTTQIFRLNSGGTLAGHVYLGGQAIDGATVRVRVSDSLTDGLPPGMIVSTKGDGRYSVPGLDDGNALVSVSVKDGATTRQAETNVHVRSGSNPDVDFYLASGTAGMRGRVIDLKDQPLEALVQAISATANGNEGVSFQTGPDGVFEITRLPAGDIVITIEVMDKPTGQRSMTYRTLTLTAGQTLVSDISAKLR